VLFVYVCVHAFHPVSKFQCVYDTLGTVELVDVSNDLPGLISCPGLQKWKVVSSQFGQIA
jgi:hypothetical protein